MRFKTIMTVSACVCGAFMITAWAVTTPAHHGPSAKFNTNNWDDKILNIFYSDEATGSATSNNSLSISLSGLKQSDVNCEFDVKNGPSLISEYSNYLSYDWTSKKIIFADSTASPVYCGLYNVDLVLWYMENGNKTYVKGSGSHFEFSLVVKQDIASISILPDTDAIGVTDDVVFPTRTDFFGFEFTYEEQPFNNTNYWYNVNLVVDTGSSTSNASTVTTVTKSSTFTADDKSWCWNLDINTINPPDAGLTSGTLVFDATIAGMTTSPTASTVVNVTVTV